MFAHLHFIIFSCVFITHTSADKIQNLEHLPIPKLIGIEQKHVFLDDHHHPDCAVHNEIHPKLDIVNGYDAPRNVCYVVFVVLTDGISRWSCGGSLIRPNAVLIAAHCLDGAVSSTLVFGAHNLADQKETGRIIILANKNSFKIHEKYDRRLFYNDIAIIRLKAAVPLSEKICTVPAVISCDALFHSPLTANSDNKNNYTVCGWGKTSDRTITKNLTCIDVPQEEQMACAAVYKEKANYNVIQSQMCTSGKGGKSTCNGDSGGPLVQSTENGTLTQRGIVSLGMSSCETGSPSVYTDHRYFTQWICQNIK